MADDLARKLECMSCKENLPQNFKDLLKSKTAFSEEQEQQRRILLEAIENYVGSDPLKPWVRCIRWAKDLCTPGVNSELIPLLELATQRFLNDSRYTEDQRYLRLWIRYADCCLDPVKVFSFLESKSIGRSHSLFYEAYAVILELRTDFANADKIYQLGISRDAQPLKQLQEMYNKFLKRKERLPSPGFSLRPETSSAAVQRITQENMVPSTWPQAGEEMKHVETLARQETAKQENIWEKSSVPEAFTKINVRQETTRTDAIPENSSEGLRKIDVPRETTRTEIIPENSSATEGSKKIDVPSETTRTEIIPENSSVPEAFRKINVPQGDETIAIKRYAEDVLVLDIDPEAPNVSTEVHHGLVDPTINTKEAMANVMSFFSEPLPFEQVRKPRKTSTDRNLGFTIFDDELDNRSNAGNSGFAIFEDEGFKQDNRSNAGNSDFIIFEDEGFNEQDNRSNAGKSELNVFVDQGCEKQAGKPGLNVFVDERYEQENRCIARKPELCNFVDEQQSRGTAGKSKSDFDIFVDEAFQPNTKKPAPGKKTALKEVFPGVDPWNDGLIDQLLKGLKPSLSTYEGFHHSSKKYNGSVPLATLQKTCRNKSLELGHSTYYIKGCTGQGAFAQVYQAHDDDHEQTVILKVQRPPCPWEFYIYRQLDKRIPAEERSSFGYAWKMHVYSDCSIMVADYCEHGTLQDVINSYLAQGQKMDELLCMYYTIEMLRMLEVLHAQGLIHGDFKPDNLLIRNESEKWEDWGPNRPGCWKDQGLCLIDWGASIDTSLFSSGTQFIGDCKTSAFRCIEMVQGRPWTFQVDTYGLCSIVHCMLHGRYMEIQEDRSSSFKTEYKPKTALKRYWNVPLWESLFKTLLNVKNCESNPPLGPLRRCFEDNMLSNPSFARKLKELLMKQTVTMSSRK